MRSVWPILFVVVGLLVAGAAVIYCWHTFTPEWAAVTGVGEEVRAAFAAEARSRVTFDIENLEGDVRLTVVHDGFAPGSAVLKAISSGWPRFFAALKDVLEEGRGYG